MKKNEKGSCKVFKLDEDENTKHQNLFSANKVVQRGKYIELNAFMTKRIKFSN